MANKLIPEELDALIQEYLTDGVLTPKEREVILKKAEKMGIDRDEIDLYLDAQVQKIDQATDAAVRKRKGKECPHCGANMPLLADKCPECDKLVTPEASKELQEILDNLEEALVDLKSGKAIERSKATVERYARKAKLYYSNNPKIKLLLAEVESEKEMAEKIRESEARKKAVKNGALSFINGTIKNKWFWAGLPFLLAVILFIRCQGSSGNEKEEMGLTIFFLVFGGIVVLSIISDKD